MVRGVGGGRVGGREGGRKPVAGAPPTTCSSAPRCGGPAWRTAPPLPAAAAPPPGTRCAGRSAPAGGTGGGALGCSALCKTEFLVFRGKSGPKRVLFFIVNFSQQNKKIAGEKNPKHKNTKKCKKNKKAILTKTKTAKKPHCPPCLPVTFSLFIFCGTPGFFQMQNADEHGRQQCTLALWHAPTTSLTQDRWLSPPPLYKHRNKGEILGGGGQPGRGKDPAEIHQKNEIAFILPCTFHLKTSRCKNWRCTTLRNSAKKINKLI